MRAAIRIDLRGQAIQQITRMREFLIPEGIRERNIFMQEKAHSFRRIIDLVFGPEEQIAYVTVTSR